MKILNAWIEDPTLRGQIKPALLTVVVDEYPDITIEHEPFAGGWLVGKYGPFVEYCNASKVDAGDYNMKFAGRFQPVVDIALMIDTPDMYRQSAKMNFSMPLRRARQLVRKHNPQWRLLVNDKAAEHGAMLWTPVQTDPSCRHWRPSAHTICAGKPARIVRVDEVDVPMCDTHVKIHNDLQAAKRSNAAAHAASQAS